MLLVILFNEKKQRDDEPEQILDLEPFCFPHLPLMKITNLGILWNVFIFRS